MGAAIAAAMKSRLVAISLPALCRRGDPNSMFCDKVLAHESRRCRRSAWRPQSGGFVCVLGDLSGVLPLGGPAGAAAGTDAGVRHGGGRARTETAGRSVRLLAPGPCPPRDWWG